MDRKTARIITLKVMKLPDSFVCAKLDTDPFTIAKVMERGVPEYMTPLRMQDVNFFRDIVEIGERFTIMTDVVKTSFNARGGMTEDVKEKCKQVVIEEKYPHLVKASGKIYQWKDFLLRLKRA